MWAQSHRIKWNTIEHKSPLEAGSTVTHMQPGAAWIKEDRGAGKVPDLGRLLCELGIGVCGQDTASPAMVGEKEPHHCSEHPGPLLGVTLTFQGLMVPQEYMDRRQHHEAPGRLLGQMEVTQDSKDDEDVSRVTHEGCHILGLHGMDEGGVWPKAVGSLMAGCGSAQQLPRSLLFSEQGPGRKPSCLDFHLWEVSPR